MGSIKERRCKFILEALGQLEQEGYDQASTDLLWQKVRDHDLFPHYSAYETMAGLVRWMAKRGAIERLPDAVTRRNVTWRLTEQGRQEQMEADR